MKFSSIFHSVLSLATVAVADNGGPPISIYTSNYETNWEGIAQIESVKTILVAFLMTDDCQVSNIKVAGSTEFWMATLQNHPETLKNALDIMHKKGGHIIASIFGGSGQEIWMKCGDFTKAGAVFGAKFAQYAASKMFDGVDWDAEGAADPYRDFATFVISASKAAKENGAKFVGIAPQPPYMEVKGIGQELVCQLFTSPNIDAIYMQYYNNPQSISYGGPAPQVSNMVDAADPQRRTSFKDLAAICNPGAANLRKFFIGRPWISTLAQQGMFSPSDNTVDAAAEDHPVDLHNLGCHAYASGAGGLMLWRWHKNAEAQLAELASSCGPMSALVAPSGNKQVAPSNDVKQIPVVQSKPDVPVSPIVSHVNSNPAPGNSQEADKAHSEYLASQKAYESLKSSMPSELEHRIGGAKSAMERDFNAWHKLSTVHVQSNQDPSSQAASPEANRAHSEYLASKKIFDDLEQRLADAKGLEQRVAGAKSAMERALDTWQKLSAVPVQSNQASSSQAEANRAQSEYLASKKTYEEVQARARTELEQKLAGAKAAMDSAKAAFDKLSTNQSSQSKSSQEIHAIPQPGPVSPVAPAAPVAQQASAGGDKIALCESMIKGTQEGWTVACVKLCSEVAAWCPTQQGVEFTKCIVKNAPPRQCV